MKKILLNSLVFFSIGTHAQLVLNNGIMLKMNGGTSNTSSATFVLNSPPATPIKQVGTTTSQGVILESEWNRIQYNLGNATTAITVPYISNATGTYVPFPLTVNSITAGTNSAGKTGAIRFSSTHAAALATGWDNTAYEPSDVLNMNGAACAGNNSANAIDRFWIIEPVYYSTRPAVTLNFSYLMSEADVNGGNTASLYSTLQPQRYDTSVAAACAWNGFPTTAAEFGSNSPAACCGNNVGTLTSVQVSSSQFFPDWTLANYLVPLPVTILDLKGACENKNVIIKWVSSNEVNISGYLIEKSKDGMNFSNVASIASTGNSSQNTSYSYSDVTPSDNGTIYYRLSYTDNAGKNTLFRTISVNGCNTSHGENGTIYSHAGNVKVNLYSLSEQNVQLTAYDVTGRLIYENTLFASEGSNSYTIKPELAQGIYLFELKTNNFSIVKRILIEN